MRRIGQSDFDGHTYFSGLGAFQTMGVFFRRFGFQRPEFQESGISDFGIPKPDSSVEDKNQKIKKIAFIQNMGLFRVWAY